MSGAAIPSWMGGDPEVGETFVQGKDTEMAKALLAAARELKLDPCVVRTVAHGFIVPNPVYDLLLAEHAGTGNEF